MTAGLFFLWLGGYVAAGVFVTLVLNALALLEGWDMDAEGMTAASLFWPFCMPDLVFRLWAGRWFGERRRARHFEWPCVERWRPEAPRDTGVRAGRDPDSSDVRP
jgi:hypothetical protein